MGIDDFIGKKPWMTFGVGVGAGLGLGALLWKRKCAAQRKTTSIEAREGETICMTCDTVEQTLHAFYGSPDYVWKAGLEKERVFLTSAGSDVTDIVKSALSERGRITANNKAFGDPAPGREKILMIEVPTALTSSFSVLTNDGEEEPAQGDEDAAENKDRNVPPMPPIHYVLRPGSDPRLDKSMYVRYDPIGRKTGAIIIVIPGGNYDESGISGGEGQPIAIWLTQQGITAVVLQYRCVSEGHFWPAQFDDWKDCAKAVKDQASDWGCDPSRVGAIGFSAGGHLAAYAALKAADEIRPKLQVLVYPAIDTRTPRDGDIDPWYADQGYPQVEDSVHMLVSSSAPPAFLGGIVHDTFCPADENTDVYAEELKKYGVPYESCCTDDEDVEHGCGLLDWWTVPCEEWLRKYGWALPVVEEDP